jgi:hypothetical protein
MTQYNLLRLHLFERGTNYISIVCNVRTELISYKDYAFEERSKMKILLLLTIVFLSSTSGASKPKCRLYFRYANTCLFYNYDKPNCFQWDTTNCRISKRTFKEPRCPFYNCMVINKLIS